MKQKTKWNYGWWLVIAVVILVTVIILLNRAWIYDWVRGINYQPSSEMVAVRDKLMLTGRGEFLFNATWPELNNAEEFNENCQRDETEMAVLGCYAMGNIYVYDIEDVRLAGIRELTTAHELLHAVWARMSENEQKNLELILQKVYKDNLNTLKDDIETYAESERLEEIFVRVGTEIKDLPVELEEVYAEIFKDQDAVVDYYESYDTVFREMKLHLEWLMDEMERLQADIDEKTREYEVAVEKLNDDIKRFNDCAETAGCFESSWEFYTQRNMLIARESALDEMNDDINNIINEYNEKVNEYNESVLESRKLQSIINSKAETTEIK